MIRVTPVVEPLAFNDLVRVPGLRAIAELVGERPVRPGGRRLQKVADRREDIPSKDFPPYWREVLGDLERAYDHICAYSCFRIHVVTGASSVDHFVAKSRRWDLVYEWTNYRLACSRLNARKNDFSDVLDPFGAINDWFHLELVGFQVVPNPALSRVKRQRVKNTISRLDLNEFRDTRASHAEDYWGRRIRLATLTDDSPFVSLELRRQGRLNPEDV